MDPGPKPFANVARSGAVFDFLAVSFRLTYRISAIRLRVQPHARQFVCQILIASKLLRSQAIRFKTTTRSPGNDEMSLPVRS